MGNRILVALNFPKNPSEVPAYARHIASCMTGNAYFPSPIVPIATLLGHTVELEAAEAVRASGLRGAAAERNAKCETVHNDVKQLRTQVETVANQHGVDGAAVVASAGMSVKNAAGPSKSDFAVKQGKTSGSVILIVRHPGIVTSFDWQHSADGVHWIDSGRSVVATFDIDGLTPGILYSFRYRTLTRDGTSDWSDVVTFRVV